MTEVGDIPGRKQIDRRTAGRLAGAAALVVILGAILGPTVLTTLPPEGSPDATQVAAHGSPRPSASHGPSATSGPSATPEPWATLDVPPLQLAAAFQPNDDDALGVGTTSSFTLRSLTSTPAVELARGLQLDPAVELSIKQGPTSDVAIVTPSGELEEGLRYRVRLDAPDGALAGSWTFTTRAPLQLVGTLPADRATGVPTNTGIEVEFDQDGTTGLPDHFRIVPAVAGRFEQHDRTWAFIPEKPLAEATIYTVTVTAGVAVAGSEETLETGTSFRFETGVAASATAHHSFERRMAESRPGERLVVPLEEEYYEDDEKGEDAPAPGSKISVDVHRLPTFADVVDAALALAGPDAWAFYAPNAYVDTAGLSLVGRVEGTVLASNAGPFLRLPIEPPAGSYILTIVQDGPPDQLLMQVTTVAAYALVAEKTTVAWVNDLTADTALGGASVAIARGGALGVTDVAGVLRIDTPAALKSVQRLDYEDSSSEPPPSLLTVRAADGRRLVVPIGLRTSSWYLSGFDGGHGWRDGDDSWWNLLQTDRHGYRQTDTINVYGLIRARSDRSVPGDVELHLRPSDAPEELPLLRVRVDATERGVFTGRLRLEGVPRGSYNVDLFVDNQRVTSNWIEVSEIRKPAFKIDVQTDRHVYVFGQQVTLTASAAFYDGTPVPGVDLQFSAFDQRNVATTDAAGLAKATARAASDWAPEGWLYDYLGVAPVNPEEAQIDGSTSVVLLPSRVWLEGSGTVRDGRVVVNGSLTWADIKAMEATLDAGGSLDEQSHGAGRPIEAGSVRATVVHLVPVRTQVGTVYDYIEKKVVPAYDVHLRRDSLGTFTLTSASDGTFRLSVPAPVAKDDYEVTLRSSDPEGRPFVRTLYVSAPNDPSPNGQPYLGGVGFCGFRPDIEAHLDAPFSVTMRDGSGAAASSGRFLFLVSEQGSMEATVQTSSTFSRTLRDADLPGFTVRGIWLSDSGYAIADAGAYVDPDDKRLTIRLDPDKARYRPGGHATIAITTTDPSGRPVAADVVVQAVDEKLYTQGLASDPDPAPTLMSPTSAGFIRSYTTHATPVIDEGGCGATGGSRDEFRDVVTFQRVSTGPDGRGTVDFDLSDDLTSWHVTATAFDGALNSGTATASLPVGLPFFVDAVLAPEYLAGEEPVLRVRAFGGSLPAGATVRFEVAAPTLGLGSTAVTATAFKAARLPLPTLVAGDHRVSIGAEVTVDGRTYRDALVRTVHVVATRLSALAKSYDVLGPEFVPQGGEGLTTYTVTDAGRGRLLSLIQDLAWQESGRYDRLAAADIARRVLIDEFGVSPNNFPPSEFEASRYEQGGISLLSYSSADLFLSARAALVAPDLIASRGDLRDAFIRWAEDEAATRERTIVALAGRAGLGDDVLEQLRGFDPASITVRERLWLALAYAASGDEETALAIERDLLESAGQRWGPWVRLSTGTTLEDTLEASGLLLLLAGRLGDPLAHEVAQYLADVPSRQRVFSLELIGYVKGFLDRLSRDPGKFAWTVAGERHEVQLRPGGGYTLVLTSGQRGSFSLEPLAGELAVVTTWRSTEVSLPSSSSIRITRTVTPAADAPDDRLVRVRITVTFGTQSPPGCYRLIDLAPSGLAPVVSTAGWYDDEEEDSSAVNRPYIAGGQEVVWCADPSDRSDAYVYAARVVSPGTYLWEPAILQYELAPGVGASTPAASYTVR